MSRLERCTLEACHPGVTWGICADSCVTTKFGGIPLTADFGDSDTRSVKLSAVSPELLQCSVLHWTESFAANQDGRVMKCLMRFESSGGAVEGRGIAPSGAHSGTVGTASDCGGRTGPSAAQRTVAPTVSAADNGYTMQISRGCQHLQHTVAAAADRPRRPRGACRLSNQQGRPGRFLS